MRRALSAVLAAATALVLNSCGIPRLVYLTPPGYSDPASEYTPLFIVANPARDASEVAVFTGFELYYKFFSSDQDTERDNQSALTKDQLLSTASGFKRMYTAGTTAQPKPFIPVDMADRGSPFIIELDFNLSSSSSTPTMTYGGGVPLSPPYGTIRREATDFGEPKTFAFDAFDSGDSDLAAINWSQFSDDGILDLVVYALSFGRQDYEDAYSDPRCLGYMRYDF